jgi:hypothetical protein
VRTKRKRQTQAQAEASARLRDKFERMRDQRQRLSETAVKRAADLERQLCFLTTSYQSLLADRNALRAERDHWHTQLTDEIERLRGERDALRALDGERWRARALNLETRMDAIRREVK